MIEYTLESGHVFTVPSEIADETWTPVWFQGFPIGQLWRTVNPHQWRTRGTHRLQFCREIGPPFGCYDDTLRGALKRILGTYDEYSLEVNTTDIRWEHEDSIISLGGEPGDWKVWVDGEPVGMVTPTVKVGGGWANSMSQAMFASPVDAANELFDRWQAEQSAAPESFLGTAFIARPVNIGKPGEATKVGEVRNFPADRSRWYVYDTHGNGLSGSFSSPEQAQEYLVEQHLIREARW